MPYIASVDDVSHTFRSGWTDEDKFETHHSFYRLAAIFNVNIKRKDVAGTPFERKWIKYCAPLDPQRWKTNWQELCDLVINQSLPKLQVLAPAQGSATFQDYLKPKMYTLQLLKDNASGDAVAELIDGPTVTEASLSFFLRPESLTKLDIPVDLPQIRASDIIIIDHEEDEHQTPRKAMIAHTGEVAALIPVENATTRRVTGVVVNHSLEAIATTLELHKVKADINIPRPLAVVITEAPYNPKNEVEVAGLLYLGVPKDAKRLADMILEQIKEAHRKGLTAFWKKQIKDVLDVLRSYYIDHGFVDQYNIWVDSHQTSAWLDFPRGVKEKPFEDSDGDRLDYVFDFWMERKVRNEQK